MRSSTLWIFSIFFVCCGAIVVAVEREGGVKIRRREKEDPTAYDGKEDGSSGYGRTVLESVVVGDRDRATAASCASSFSRAPVVSSGDEAMEIHQSHSTYSDREATAMCAEGNGHQSSNPAPYPFASLCSTAPKLPLPSSSASPSMACNSSTSLSSLLFPRPTSSLRRYCDEHQPNGSHPILEEYDAKTEQANKHMFNNSLQPQKTRCPLCSPVTLVPSISPFPSSSSSSSSTPSPSPSSSRSSRYSTAQPYSKGEEDALLRRDIAVTTGDWLLRAFLEQSRIKNVLQSCDALTVSESKGIQQQPPPTHEEGKDDSPTGKWRLEAELSKFRIAYNWLVFEWIWRSQCPRTHTVPSVCYEWMRELEEDSIDSWADDVVRMLGEEEPLVPRPDKAEIVPMKQWKERIMSLRDNESRKAKTEPEHQNETTTSPSSGSSSSSSSPSSSVSSTSFASSASSSSSPSNAEGHASSYHDQRGDSVVPHVQAHSQYGGGPNGEREAAEETISFPFTQGDIPRSRQSVAGRYNYASEECGAKVLGSNPDAQHAEAVISPAKDAYYLSPCDVGQFLVLELCEEVAIEVIAIANREYFSSTFKKFSVYGSPKLPSTWEWIGNFTADNDRTLQTFAVPKDQSTYKYLKIFFGEHYGSEYYCPITFIQVYGSSLVEELKLEVESDELEMKELDSWLNRVLGGDGEGESGSSTVPSSLRSPVTYSSFVDTYGTEERASLCEVPQISEFLLPAGRCEVEEYRPNKDTVSPPPSSSQPSQKKNIFNQLAKRIKSLEINQSFTNRYLEDFSSHVWEILNDVRKERGDRQLDRKLVANILSQVRELSTGLRTSVKQQMEEEMSRKIRLLNSTYNRRLKQLSADRRYDILLCVAVSVAASLAVSFFVVCMFQTQQHNYHLKREPQCTAGDKCESNNNERVKEESFIRRSSYPWMPFAVRSNSFDMYSAFNGDGRDLQSPVYDDPLSLLEEEDPTVLYETDEQVVEESSCLVKQEASGVEIIRPQSR